MRLSILDSSPVRDGETATEAFRTTTRLAHHAEGLGFDRFWVTELHGATMNAGTTPEVTIAAVASRTTRLRIGSGAALLNQRNIFRTAETFQQLHAMYPGRIDLGVGRATAGSTIDAALGAGRQPVPGGHQAQLAELLSLLQGDRRTGGAALAGGISGAPSVWILGSTPSSALLAAESGLPYAFAGFLNPAAAAPSLAAYRTHFAPSQRDSEPRSMLALNVSCASTPDAAARAGSSAAAIYAAAARGNRLPRVPLAKDACDMLGGVPRRWRYEPGAWPATLHGTPDQLRADLSAIADEGGSDEIMVQDFIAEPEQRLESYSLLAEAFGLTPTEAADA